jgi:hypothetical protein
MAPQARAENEAGFWSALTSTTGGHSAPNPQAIAPVGRLDITPTTPEPYDEVTLDETRSYSRDSNGLITDYYFVPSGAFGLPATPQATPVATCYWKTAGVKSTAFKVKDTSGLDSGWDSKNVTVTGVTAVRLDSLGDTTVEELTPEKARNIDEAPLLGTDGAEIISTGARATRYSISVAVTGLQSEAKMKVIEGWVLNNIIVDVPYYDDDRTVYQILRGYLTGFSRQIRGGEPDTKWFSCSIVVLKRLYYVLDEVVTFASGVGTVVNYPIADANGDGIRKDDVRVCSQPFGAGVNKPVDEIDYPSDTVSMGLREVRLVDTGWSGALYVSYWYEVRK